ncbi:hydroxymethylglutaryl-CoA synthase [Archaeoglobus profundus]|uniref:Hydroxymethylglutaryl-CoA synthase n=1 Tax=Archaeoglobus profundus (strain DSM 5631 / JCM 9629 / NBRC 100127 / Av18) TaxID=572546 RepID=D2RFZ1_ARCPA|nr:hydroxymethylglutaryl-CoA synthase [Archaeoglobus profundus]ADB57216.1 hydroxymethylglutaryl-CoA synthase [Archaeoglobus profundus DSM 5631]
MVGIVSYGTYIPRYRIKVDEIARIWGENAEVIKNGLGVEQKSVPGSDEDTATIAVEAGREALKRAKIDPKKIGAVFVGSESHPYAVKPTGTIVAEALGVGNDYFCADLEFACKAGTTAMQICYAMVRAGIIEYGIAIGADTSQSRPGDPLEYTAGAGGACFIIGRDCIAEIEGTYSFASDTPDFWRREGQPYPSHGGRFTGQPAYFRHIVGATQGLLEKLGLKPSDFTYAVFHQPNGKFPMRVAKMLGFTKEQVKQGLVVPYIGNTYSGSSMIGLASVLDVAKPGDRILLTSFGSGAGSDAFSFVVTDKIEDFERNPTVFEKIKSCEYVDYGMYVKLRRKIRFG